jgi:2-oxoisovalerate dehydrogenase E1 component
VAQAMNELAFDDLDAPVGRLHTDAQPHPLAPSLEREMLVDSAKIVAGAKSVLGGKAPVPKHWRYVGGRAATVATPEAAKVNSSATTTPVTAAPLTPGEGEPITMPFGDLTISEGTIVGWLKAEGDAVKAGDIVAEIETDKAVVEIEAPVDGKLGPIEQQKGAVVPMGGRIGSVLA